MKIPKLPIAKKKLATAGPVARVTILNLRNRS